jgi:hypothetical protein
MQAEVPTDYEDFIQFVVKMDNKRRKLEVAQTRQGPSRPRQPHFAQPTQYTQRPQVDVYAPNYYGARPMDLSSAEQPEAHAATSTQPPRGPLSQQERDHRRQNRLCMRCGQPGHFARDHPDYRPRPQQGAMAPTQNLAPAQRTYATAASAEVSKDQA